MSHKKGAYLGGIRDTEGLKLRCFVEAESGCWLWRGGMSHGAPSVTLLLPDGQRSQAMRGQRAAQMLIGVEMGVKDVAHPYKCQNILCVNPAHGGVKTRKKHGEWMKARGLCASNPKHIAATVKRNKDRAIVTPEMIEQMRASDLTCAEMGRRLGISPSSVSNYRRGVTGRPAAMRHASVFTWRPAA